MEYAYWITLIVHLLVAPYAALHALLFKRDPRAALGWIAMCVLVPLWGALFYFLFGINRVETRARKLHGFPKHSSSAVYFHQQIIRNIENSRRMTHHPALLNVGNAILRKPTTPGNEITLLINGEQAYPTMLESIDTAADYIYITSYIFDVDDSGQMFIDALAAARERGVNVKVLVDSLGEAGSLRRASSALNARGINVGKFLPFTLMPPSIHFNLRNHRKILVVDGRDGYTGGMNISERHLLADKPQGEGVADLHFNLRGPIVQQLEEVFCMDWEFATNEKIQAKLNSQAGEGEALCRVVYDGPNEHFDKLLTLLIGAVSVAKKSIYVCSPYFLPTRELLAALQIAALRGVQVKVLVPQTSDARVVDWATRNMLWQLIEHGVVVYYLPKPFEHSKLFVVDGEYALIGSANIDSRSLRLNFELNVEVYSQLFAAELVGYMENKLENATLVSIQSLEGRSLPLKIRDATAWLFSPYL